jgi:hypothetical protein
VLRTSDAEASIKIVKKLVNGLFVLANDGLRVMIEFLADSDFVLLNCLFFELRKNQFIAGSSRIRLMPGLDSAELDESGLDSSRFGGAGGPFLGGDDGICGGYGVVVAGNSLLQANVYGFGFPERLVTFNSFERCRCLTVEERNKGLSEGTQAFGCCGFL